MEIHNHHLPFGSGFGGGVGVGVVTGPGTGEYVGDGLGFSVLGDGLGDGLGEGVVIGGFGDGVGGYPFGSSPNTAVALSNNRITTLSQTSDLWVECAFMGVLLSSLAALSAEHSRLLEMFLQEKMFRASESGPHARRFEIFFVSDAYRVKTAHSLSLEDDDACVLESPDFPICSVAKHSRH